MVFGWGNGKYVSSCGRSPAVGNYYATTALALGELKVVQPKREIYIYANGTKNTSDTHANFTLRLSLAVSLFGRLDFSLY